MIWSTIFKSLVDSITGEGNGNPLQYSCLENPMDRGSWWTRVHRIVKELDTTEWLNNNHSWLCCHNGALLKTHSEYKPCLINFHSCQITCIYNTTKISKYANSIYSIKKNRCCIIDSVLHSDLLVSHALVSWIKLQCWNMSPKTLSLLLSKPGYIIPIL